MADSKGLKVEVVAGRLVMSIDTDTLVHALEYGLNERGGTEGRVTDAKAFLADFLVELEAEEEDGTNAIHRMFDAVADSAIENGAEGWEEGEGED